MTFNEILRKSSPTQALFLTGRRKTEPSPTALTHEVIIEEVGIEQSLDDTTKVNNPMMTISRLVISPKDPIHNVKSTIRPHEEDVISSQVLHFTETLKDNQLRENCHRLKVYTERPQKLLDFHKAKNSRPANQVRYERQRRTRSHSKLPVTKSILRLIVRRTNRLLETNRKHNARRGGNVQNFHHRVVHTVERCEEVGVAGEKDEEEEFMGAEGYSGGVFGDAEAEDEDDDGEDVGHVPAETENVHTHGCCVFFLGLDNNDVGRASSGELVPLSPLILTGRN